MNPTYFGDSYDLVKRFFCCQLDALGYEVIADPMFTGKWEEELKSQFFRLIGACPRPVVSNAPRRALFIDPDTGVNEHGGKRHVTVAKLVAESDNYSLVFAFDQSFSRRVAPEETMAGKLSAIHKRGRYAMYYNSHARFLFIARKYRIIEEFRNHLLRLGLPQARLIQSGAQSSLDGLM